MKNEYKHIRFGNVATFSRGLTFTKGDAANESSKMVLRSNNIDLSTHTLNFDEIAYLKEDFVIPEDKKLHKGDIFICMSNGSTQHLGKVAFIDKDLDYAFGGFMGAVHPDAKLLCPKFAFYACLSSDYRRYLASIFNGININNLKWSDLSNLMIPVPSLEEQERIVAELDLLTGIIDKQKAQLKELDTLAQSIFYDMFGDPQTNEKGWALFSISSICCELFAGGDKPKDCVGEKDSEYRYPVIGNGDGEKGIIGYSKYYRVGKRSVAIGARGASIGNCRVCEPCFTPVVRLITLVPNGNVNISYLFNLVTKLSFNVNGAGQAQLTIPNVANVQVPIPPIVLQESFAAKIEAIEFQKQSITRSIAETQKLFDYTMDKYFG